MFSFGNIQRTIEFLVSVKPDSVQRPDQYGLLSLRLACQSHWLNEEIISLLIAHYPSAVQFVDWSTNRTILHRACQEHASLAFIKLLVGVWPEAVEMQDEALFLPLHRACMGGPSNAGGKRSLEKIKYLVQVSPKTLQVPGQWDMLPLHWACLDPIASTDVIRYLIESYPEAVKVKDNRGRLPLHLACVQEMSAALETMECLVHAWPESVRVVCNDHGAVSRAVLRRMPRFQYDRDLLEYCDRYPNSDNSDRGNCGSLALDLVCDAMELLVSNAVESQISEKLIRLLAYGMPPLHFASMFSIRTSTLEYLASKFPDGPTSFHHGMLPLHCAIRAGAPWHVIEWWLDKYPVAVCTSTSDTGDLPLHCYLSCKLPVAPKETSTGTEKFPALPIIWEEEEIPPRERAKIERIRLFLGELKKQVMACGWVKDQQTYLTHLEKFIEVHPAAVSSVNWMGLLPLHVAIMHDSPLDVLVHLARVAPEGFF